ncbi:competence type IV pilus minor pilin ComGF [Bacillus sp. Marseille-Q3570]|uniref:competence type IV pilus minor pilin ComGF n=1 Tax=Bacillus sp. Marseille-Q3570 TaxID=2963522 RepID=UPI0021B71637|nr:competence type IV pilus minor pilin ComGF [Bacillus sp. Marseille-Q3570]
MDEKSQFVVKHEGGYTLLEMIISLSIFLTLAALTPLMFSAIFSTSGQPLHHQEISLFFEQADKELQGSISAEKRWNRLNLMQPDGNEISYEKNGDRIVRKVNGAGFEIILQDIQSFRTENDPYSVELIVQTSDDFFTHKATLIEPFLNQRRTP